MTGVPKVIHYCWFGGGALTEQAERSIASWKEHAPGFEIRRWDDSNFNLDACAFVRSAYDARKWAFVSDYARFRVLYDHGGIYMDVGSELVRDISILVPYSPFSAIEDGTKTVTTGLVASCEAANPVVKEVLDAYENLEFEDSPGFMSSHTVNEMFTGVMERYGYIREDRLQHVAGWTILPCECFDPKLGCGGYKLTDNTYSIHKGSASWAPEYERFRLRLINRWAPVFGDFIARKAARVLTMIRYRRRR